MAACAVSVVREPAVYGEAITLKRKLAAIQIESDGGATRLGLFLHLTPGSRVEVCGAGFSPRTVQVRSEGAYYFVLKDSLGSLRLS